MLFVYKHELHNRLYNRFKYPIIDKLTSCEYCIETHIGTALALIYGLSIMNINVVIYGIMAAGLSNILKK